MNYQKNIETGIFFANSKKHDRTDDIICNRTFPLNVDYNENPMRNEDVF